MFLWLPVFYPSDWRVVTFGHSLLAVTFGWFFAYGPRRTEVESTAVA